MEQLNQQPYADYTLLRSRKGIRMTDNFCANLSCRITKNPWNNLGTQRIIIPSKSKLQDNFDEKYSVGIEKNLQNLGLYFVNLFIHSSASQQSEVSLGFLSGLPPHLSILVLLLQFLTPALDRSSVTSSSHLSLGHPTLLVPRVESS